MSPAPSLLAILGVSVVLTLGAMVLPVQVSAAITAPLEGQSIGIPNPFDALLPDHLAKLIQDTATFLLGQLVSGLHGLILNLTQGEDNVITHTPPSMTYQQAAVIDKHEALVKAMDWGFAAALAVLGLLVIVGPNSRLSYGEAGEIVPRLVIAYVGAHSSLQWGASFIDLNNVLCSAVAPADPFPAGAPATAEAAFGLLGLAVVYLFMALFLGLFMFARAQLIAALLILAPLAAVLWVVPGRARQWGELWLDLFFSNLFVQFIQVLSLNLGVGLMQTAGDDVLAMRQFLAGAATLLLVFPYSNAGRRRRGRWRNQLPGDRCPVPRYAVHGSRESWRAYPANGHPGGDRHAPDRAPPARVRHTGVARDG